MTLTNEQVPVALPPPAFTGHVSAVLAVRCRDTLAATNGSLDKRTPFPQTFRPDTPVRAATFTLPTMSRRPSPAKVRYDLRGPNRRALLRQVGLTAFLGAVMTGPIFVSAARPRSGGLPAMTWCGG
jgi:hypothetical protein